MRRPPSSSKRVLTFLLLAWGACAAPGGDPVPAPGAEQARTRPTPSPDAGRGGAGESDGRRGTGVADGAAALDGAGAGASDGGRGSAAAPGPPAGCGAPLPRAFTITCGGCHGSGGPGPFPDLFRFAGDARAFVEKVRKGGGVMPAFRQETISDEELAAVFAHLQAGPAAAAVCAPIAGPGTCGAEPARFEPLFPAAPAGDRIVSTGADGVIVTRGAGRVRGRHELEETFAPYHGRYWENRSYAFEIEDSVRAGGGTIKIVYRPIASVSQHGSPTNLRAWKVYGAGNVFHVNADMQKVTPTELTYTVSRNARDKRALAVGDLLEFEFGIFIAGQDPRDPGAIEGRTNYYSDTFRYRVGEGGLTAENRDRSGRPGPAPAAMLGGDTTSIPWLYAEPELAFTQMALAIQRAQVQPFLEGRRLFHTRFDTGAHTEKSCAELRDPIVCNPLFTEQAGKAGPRLNATTCTGCHLRNGRGLPLAPGGKLDGASTMVFKLYDAGALGNQLQLGEGTAEALAPASREVRLGDGTPVTLQKPVFDVRSGDGGVPRHSARVARPLVGMGLLEAVAEEEILARADAADCNRDGIAGRPQIVADPRGGKSRVGRFGWKAEKVSVEHQVADALDADMGVSTTIIPDGGGKAELADGDLAKLTAYMRLLGVPGRRDADAPEAKRGEELFGAVGCAGCHAPTMRTGDRHPFPELRNQVIRPYSDLLLHDLGEDLADASGTAQARLWRTPPLWGIGLTKLVSGETRFLHDGRARSLLEAILWHGGEAESVKGRFAALPRADRDALLAFLGSL